LADHQATAKEFFPYLYITPICAHENDTVYKFEDQ